jgi:hypothetical protein
LEYSKGPGTKTLGFINVDEILSLSPSPSNPSSFTIATSLKSYPLEAPSEREAKHWIEIISSHLKKSTEIAKGSDAQREGGKEEEKAEAIEQKDAARGTPVSLFVRPVLPTIPPSLREALSHCDTSKITTSSLETSQNIPSTLEVRPVIVRIVPTSRFSPIPHVTMEVEMAHASGKSLRISKVSPTPSTAPNRLHFHVEIDHTRHNFLRDKRFHILFGLKNVSEDREEEKCSLLSFGDVEVYDRRVVIRMRIVAQDDLVTSRPFFLFAALPNSADSLSFSQEFIAVSSKGDIVPSLPTPTTLSSSLTSFVKSYASLPCGASCPLPPSLSSTRVTQNIVSNRLSVQTEDEEDEEMERRQEWRERCHASVPERFDAIACKHSDATVLPSTVVSIIYFSSLTSPSPLPSKGASLDRRTER